MSPMAMLQNLLTLVFAVSSMFAMGLAHTPREVLAPLRSIRVMGVALLVNFVLVPAAAFLLSKVTTNVDFGIGLILLGAVAGSPVAAKLAQIAEGDLPLATGLLALLVVGTVIYVPLVLPLALPGVGIDGGAVAVRLSLELLVPLALGLAVRVRYEEGAISMLPDVHRLANVSLVLLLALMVLMNVGKILGMFGSGAVLATILLVAIAVASGWLLGGPRLGQRTTLGVATGQRNFAAAFVVASGSFAARPDVFVFLAGASIIVLAIMFVFAAEIRRFRQRRMERREAAASARGGVSPGGEVPAH